MPGLVFLACAFGLLAHLDASFSCAPRLIQLLRWLGPAALALLAIDVGLKDRDFSAFLWTMLVGVLVLRRWPTPQSNGITRWLEAAHAPCLWAIAAMMLGVPLAAALLLGWLALFVVPPSAGIFRLMPGLRTALAGVSGTAVACLMALQAATAYLELPDWHNHPVYAAAHRGNGFLLTCSNLRALQMRTRRPVLLEGPALNQLPYVPESGPTMNRILKDVYGEDLFADRPYAPRGGGLTKESGRELWEARSAEQWQALAGEFGFTQIVTYDTWNLKLPLVASAEKLRLYEVPVMQAARLHSAAEPHR
jgi:hypothetical protein